MDPAGGGNGFSDPLLGSVVERGGKHSDEDDDEATIVEDRRQTAQNHDESEEEHQNNVGNEGEEQTAHDGHELKIPSSSSDRLIQSAVNVAHALRSGSTTATTQAAHRCSLAISDDLTADGTIQGAFRSLLEDKHTAEPCQSPVEVSPALGSELMKETTQAAGRFALGIQDDSTAEGTISGAFRSIDEQAAQRHAARGWKGWVFLACAFVASLLTEFIDEEFHPPHLFVHHPHGKRNDEPPAPAPAPTTQVRFDDATACSTKLSFPSSFELDDPRLRAVEWFAFGPGKDVDLSSCGGGSEFQTLYALVLFRESMTDGDIDSWRQEGKEKMHLEDVCRKWNRMACETLQDGSQAVVALHMSNANLTGTLPPELGLLTQLQRLEAYDNMELEGSLPVQWKSLRQLQALFLHHTSISGTVPPQWESMGQLKEAFFERTPLSGTMPSSFCQLRRSGNLQALHADCGGTSPTIICECPSCCTECLPPLAL